VFGFIPLEATYLNDHGGFHSFQTGDGILHDVFEHDFEGLDASFQDKFSFNIGGEIAASGSSYYFSEIMDRFNSSYKGPDVILIDTITALISQSIEYGDLIYGSELLSNVKEFKREELDSSIEYISEQVLKNVSEMVPHEYDDSGILYKESVTFEKISNLLQWGYDRAFKLAPSHYGYYYGIQCFKDFFTEFFSKNDMEEMSYYYEDCKVEVYQGDHEIQWVFTMESFDSEVEDFVINSTIESDLDRHTFYVGDYYS